MITARLSQEQKLKVQNRGRFAVCGNMDCEWTGPLSSCLIHPNDDVPVPEPWPQVGCPCCGKAVKIIKWCEKDDI